MIKKFELRLAATGNIDNLRNLLHICKENDSNSLHFKDFPFTKSLNSLFFSLSSENELLTITGLFTADIEELVFGKEVTSNITGLLELSESLDLHIELKSLAQERNYGECFVIEHGKVLSQEKDVMDYLEPEFICLDEYARFIRIHNLEGRKTPAQHIIRPSKDSLQQIASEFSDAMLVIEKDDIYHCPAIISSDNYMRLS
jgi:hypothetical protein